MTSEEEQIRSIQLELDRVEDLGGLRNNHAAGSDGSRGSNHACRTRAGFNSIRDALGNIRARLSALGHHHQHTHHGGSASSAPSGAQTTSCRTNAAGGETQNSPRQQRSQRHVSLIQQLSDRLHMVDMAHSSRIPLDVIAQRRHSHTVQTNTLSAAAAHSTTTENIHSSVTSTPLQAPIFHFSIRESFASSFEHHVSAADHPTPEAAAATSTNTTLPTTPRMEHRRSSLLFASRLSAHRSIMAGSGNDLLASGGGTDAEEGVFMGISSFSGSGLHSFTGQGSMRDLGRDNTENHASPYFDLERHVHPSVSRDLLSPITERRIGSRCSSLESEESRRSAAAALKTEETKDGDVKMEFDADNLTKDEELLDREESTNNKKLKMREEDDDEVMQHVDDAMEVVPPLLTRQASKSMLSLSKSQHDHLSGSLVASPRTSSFVEGNDIDRTSATDNSCLVYSWGWGNQSLHDDNDDRLPVSMLEKSQSTESIAQQLLVTSRLGTKSIMAVSAGQHHSACATSQGTLYVAGTNFHGCVDPDAPDEQVYSKPRILDSIGAIRVVQVSCGFDHSAALSSNGSVLSWGSNSDGQLGHRKTNQQSSSSGPNRCRPAGMVLSKGRRASSIACGNRFTLVLTTRMSMLACGIPLIAGHREPSEWGSPREVPSLVGLPLVAISAGDEHASVVTTHGSAFVWGSNRKGCCGREYPRSLAVPMPVKVKSSIVSSASGRPSPFKNWTVMKKSDGLLVKQSDDVAIQHAACGAEHTVFVTRSGRLLSCGNNDRGQLGLAACDEPSMKVVSVQHPTEGKRFVSAEAGNAHSVLLDSDGDVWLTTGSGLQRVVEGKSVVAIAAGGDDNCIVIASPPSGGKMLKRQFSVESAVDGETIVDTVESLLDEMDSESDKKLYAGQEIAKRTEELVRYPAVLNSLFLDPKELDEMFQRIKQGDIVVRKAVASAIERGLKEGLLSLRDTRLMYPEAVRCLLSYIRFFDIQHEQDVSFDVRGDCLATVSFVWVPY